MPKLPRKSTKQGKRSLSIGPKVWKLIEQEAMAEMKRDGGSNPNFSAAACRMILRGAAK